MLSFVYILLFMNFIESHASVMPFFWQSLLRKWWNCLLTSPSWNYNYTIESYVEPSRNRMTGFEHGMPSFCLCIYSISGTVPHKLHCTDSTTVLYVWIHTQYLVHSRTQLWCITTVPKSAFATWYHVKQIARNVCIGWKESHRFVCSWFCPHPTQCSDPIKYRTSTFSL